MKKLITWTIIAAILMIGCPWLTVGVAGPDGMAICFILFFAINPLFSVLCGAIAGINIRQLWSLPIITAVLFLAGVWIFFDMGELDFLIYSACYLAIGVVAMLISVLIKKIKRSAKKDESNING